MAHRDLVLPLKKRRDIANEGIDSGTSGLSRSINFLDGEAREGVTYGLVVLIYLLCTAARVVCA